MNEHIKRLSPVVYAAAATFAITLTILIGERLTDEAIAALAGAVCGVGAAIPASLLIFAITQRRHDATNRTLTPPQPRMTQPQVMMIPPMMIPPQSQPSPPATWETASVTRHFTIVGGETE